ncbi:MAG: hypothetical protein MZV65_44920 [Chromatiales bacterium]|nr:hypothetical protein [Chromatiales bacterium]
MIGTSGPLRLDHGVVDLAAAQRRQQMLDRVHRHALPIGDRGTQLRLDHVAPVRRDRALPGLDIQPQEADTGIGRRGPQAHADPVSAVQAAADTAELAGHGVLPGPDVRKAIRRHAVLRSV